jgi:hypothetical protein
MKLISYTGWIVQKNSLKNLNAMETAALYSVVLCWTPDNIIIRVLRLCPSGTFARTLRPRGPAEPDPEVPSSKARGLPRALGTRSMASLRPAFGSCPATDVSQGLSARRQALGLPMSGGSLATLPRHTPASCSSDRITPGVTQGDKASQQPPRAEGLKGPRVSP